MRAEECAREGVVDNPVDIDDGELRAEECAREGVVDNPVGVGYGVGVQVEEWRCWLRC